MTQKQIEELKKLCLSCGDKYVRVDYEFEGIKSMVFLKNPRFFCTFYTNLLAIKSFDSVEISTQKKTDEGSVRDKLQWTNQKIVVLDRVIRIYKTPFSAKAVKRIVDNIFNNKLK